MKPNDIHDAIGMIGDDLIEEVDTKRGTKKKRYVGIVKYASVAACICLVSAVVTVSLFTGRRNENPPTAEGSPVVENTHETQKTVLENVTENGNDGNGVTNAPRDEENKGNSPSAGANPPLTNGSSQSQTESYIKPDPIYVTSSPEGSHKISDGYLVNVSADTRNVTVEDRTSYYNFSADLFRLSHVESANTLVSPLSAYMVLSMLSNGAEGNTLAEIESTLGMERDKLNEFVHSYMKYRNNMVSNSVWLDSSFPVLSDFLEKNANYYSADIFSTDFSDETVNAVNSWVSEKTNGMIDELLTDIPHDTVMMLLNALTFDKHWEHQYKEDDVSSGIFTTARGEYVNVEYMHSTENVYLEDEDSVGFAKYFNGRSYAFVTLLPHEGVSIDSYVSSLTGDKIKGLFETTDRYNTRVTATMPKFTTEYNCDSLADTLKTMGIIDAFDAVKADFSSITDEDLYVGIAKQKTFIEVSEDGTKAGAATLIGLQCGGSAPTQYKTITLDRPFVYMIIDCRHNLPLFIGTVSDPTK